MTTKPCTTRPSLWQWIAALACSALAVVLLIALCASRFSRSGPPVLVYPDVFIPVSPRWYDWLIYPDVLLLLPLVALLCRARLAESHATNDTPITTGESR